MMTPIQQQQNPAAPTAHKRDWCCGTSITGPHVPGCASEPRPAGEPEPPVSDPHEGSAPAASAVPRQYGFKKRKESDVELPSGAFVRIRQLTTTKIIKLGVLNMRDAFGAELMKNIDGDDAELAAAAAEEAEQWVADPEKSDKVLGVLDRVAESAVLCPKVVLSGPSTDEQINANDIDLVDKWMIFNAAMPDELQPAAQEAQQDALKSVRTEQAAVLRDIRDGEAVQPAPE